MLQARGAAAAGGGGAVGRSPLLASAPEKSPATTWASPVQRAQGHSALAGAVAAAGSPIRLGAQGPSTSGTLGGLLGNPAVAVSAGTASPPRPAWPVGSTYAAGTATTTGTPAATAAGGPAATALVGLQLGGGRASGALPAHSRSASPPTRGDSTGVASPLGGPVPVGAGVGGSASAAGSQGRSSPGVLGTRQRSAAMSAFDAVAATTSSSPPQPAANPPGGTPAQTWQEKKYDSAKWVLLDDDDDDSDFETLHDPGAQRAAYHHAPPPPPPQPATATAKSAPLGGGLLGSGVSVTSPVMPPAMATSASTSRSPVAYNTHSPRGLAAATDPLVGAAAAQRNQASPPPGFGMPSRQGTSLLVGSPLLGSTATGVRLGGAGGKGAGGLPAAAAHPASPQVEYAHDAAIPAAAIPAGTPFATAATPAALPTNPGGLLAGALLWGGAGRQQHHARGGSNSPPPPPLPAAAVEQGGVAGASQGAGFGGPSLAAPHGSSHHHHAALRQHSSSNLLQPTLLGGGAVDARGSLLKIDAHAPARGGEDGPGSPSSHERDGDGDHSMTSGSPREERSMRGYGDRHHASHDDVWSDDDQDDLLEQHLKHSTYTTLWEEAYTDAPGMLDKAHLFVIDFKRGALAVKTKIPLKVTLTAREAKRVVAEKLSSKYHTLVDPASYVLRVRDAALAESEFLYGDVPLAAYSWVRKRLFAPAGGGGTASSLGDASPTHTAASASEASPNRSSAPMLSTATATTAAGSPTTTGGGSPAGTGRASGAATTPATPSSTCAPHELEVDLVPLSSVLEIVPPSASQTDGAVAALRNDESLLEIRDRRGKLLRVRRRSCTRANSQQTVTITSLDGPPVLEDGCYVFRFIHTHELTLSNGDRITSESHSEERIHPQVLPQPEVAEGRDGHVVSFASDVSPPGSTRDKAGATRPRSGTVSGARKRGFTENAPLLSSVRGLVSKKKIRYKEGGYDLDLTYITNDIIAMGFPSLGTEAMYRNKMDDVEAFFEERHGTNYKVYNLCQERTYEMTRFHGSVARYPFYDHCPPPFEQMLVFCRDVHEFLQRDPNNVVSIHCKAGKGRTGTMICAYLLYAERINDSHEALEFYGLRRTKDGKGVTIPSQIRYVHYFGTLMRDYDRGRLTPPERVLILQAVRFASVPHYRDGGCDPYFVMYRHSMNSNGDEKLYDSREESSIKFMVSRQALKLSRTVIVRGDAQVDMYHFDNRYGKSQRMFTFFFNTSFIPASNVLYLEKKDLDKAVKDKESKYFDDDFAIECIFKPVEDLPQRAVNTPEL